jgi:hypothetical protein
MSACLAFEGIKFNNNEVLDIRVAVGDVDQITRTNDFISDPIDNIGSCCKVGNCEELYMAQIHEACAVNSDCVDELVCKEGICGDPLAENDLDKEQDESEEDQLPGSIGTYHQGTTWTFFGVMMSGFVIVGW